MSGIPAHFKVEASPVAEAGAVVRCGAARFTVLTARLIRLEHHAEGRFEDRASQAFWYRQQPVPAFEVRQDGGVLEIETDAILLRYTEDAGQGFTPETLQIMVKSTGALWTPGLVDTQNLRGTTRTLDFVNGYEPLSAGLMSRAGWSVMDDSQTLVFNEESWLVPREAGGTDLYFFGSGRDYRACLRDYCQVSGHMPLIPRWILGNWWSRFWHYTQDEMVTLLNDFQRYALPFSVCIIDMDWHITQTGNTSSGWTGYTWNRKLFPQPEALIDFMHTKNLKVSMNLHPADGIHPHEEYYPEMARRMGIEPETGQPVAFDIANTDFVNAYFDVLHRPHEKMGVDFWWIDWQQGLESAIPGLDPLWLINHLHFYDQGRLGKRPFIFSRWGNEGHQRYPIGFSGDSYATWDSLAFESYMTAAASNIAYGWWSHDIGGHTSGTEDPELFTRWVQFGVFSPINRIHVTKGEFYDRRPWMFEDENTLKVLREALQLRHAFIPYLYTMAQRAHAENLPLILPMYYDYPEDEQAYHVPHQYKYGSELIAAPFVSPADADTGLSRQVVWLPDGDWTHFFTGEHFSGGWHAIYGKLHDIPLFAKAGAIVPLNADTTRSGADNPDALNIHVFAGADGRFDLYEDDGETLDYRAGLRCITAMSQTWRGDALDFALDAAQGDTSLIPVTRTINLAFHSISTDAQIHVTVNGTATTPESRYDAQTETLHLSGITLAVSDSLAVSLSSSALLSHRDRTAETFHRLLKSFRLAVGLRNRIWEKAADILADPAALAPYLLPMSESQGRALCELLYAAGVHHVGDTHHPDLIVLWNNREDARITYRYGEIYLWFGQVPHAEAQNGPVPKFAHFIPQTHSWRHGAQGEHTHKTQWRAQIDYANLFTAGVQHREETP